MTKKIRQLNIKAQIRENERIREKKNREWIGSVKEDERRKRSVGSIIPLQFRAQVTIVKEKT